MKKITMLVVGLVFITVLVSLFSYQSLEPKNVFGKDVVEDEETIKSGIIGFIEELALEDEEAIKSAYIDGFMDALMLGENKIKRLQGNREAIKQEAITAADVYYNNVLNKQ